MEMSDKTARQIWAEVKANPNRARFGYGKKAVLVNIDFQRAYTRPDEFKTAYETDPRQIEHVNALAQRFRQLGWPVVWTHVAYAESGRGRRGLGHTHQHARFAAEHQARLASAPELDARCGRPARARPRALHKRMAIAVLRNAAAVAAGLPPGSTRWSSPAVRPPAACAPRRWIVSLSRGYRTIVPGAMRGRQARELRTSPTWPTSCSSTPTWSPVADTLGWLDRTLAGLRSERLSAQV
jgi:hypothetical protein